MGTVVFYWFVDSAGITNHIQVNVMSADGDSCSVQCLKIAAGKNSRNNRLRTILPKQ